MTIISGILILSIIQSASGTQYAAGTAKPSGLLSMQSDTQLQGFGPGILKFNKNLANDYSCNDITPKPEIKIVERKKDSLLNIDEKYGYFFIVLGQLNATSYQYLQIGLQRNNDLGGQGQVTNPSYIIDLKKQGQPLMGGLYQGYSNFAVVLESDKDTSTYPEENNKKYLDGTSKNVTYRPDRLGPGEYDFHAILFQSDTPDWINHDVCAISLNWKFSVNDEGTITTNSPIAEKGKLSDVTKEFPPLQQHKKGVNLGDIECRHGLQLIMKATNGEPACVKPETKSKLIERGWALNDHILPVLGGPVSLSSDKVKIILSEGIDDYDSDVTFHPPYVKTILNSNNTVTWINEKSVPVKLESDEGYFSTEIQPGESFSFIFDKVGVHRYHSPENWKRGTVIVSTEKIESSNLVTADLFKKNPDEIAKTIALILIPDDKIIKKRLDNTFMSAYVTEKSADIIVPKMLCLLCYLNSYNPIEYRYGMKKALVYPKDESAALDFAKDFLAKVGYNMDGSEWIDKVNFGDRIEVSIQQRAQGWIIPNHFTRFEFYKDHTWISLGRWYNEISEYEFKLSQDDAKKIAKEHMDIEVKNNPNLKKYEYQFESINDGVRVIIFDDKPLYLVPVGYKASAKLNYENGHCGGPEFLSVYVMVEGQNGAVLGWDYPGCA